MSQETLARELEHHEELYSGVAQKLFARPAVRALREHMARRILEVTGAGKDSRVLSVGCGIGDTELLLAPRVRSITGIDLSPSAIRQARADADAAGVKNAEFLESSAEAGTLAGRSFDLVIGVFFLHHVPDDELPPMATRIHEWLAPGGVFYGLDPSRYRLSGAIGNVLIPWIMRKYQTPDERELRPVDMLELFSKARFEARTEYFDFTSTPFAGLFPSWKSGYRAMRALDEALIRTPLLRGLSSNFEIIARRVK